MNKIKKCEFCNNSYPVKSNKGGDRDFVVIIVEINFTHMGGSMFPF